VAGMCTEPCELIGLLNPMVNLRLFIGSAGNEGRSPESVLDSMGPGTTMFRKY